MRRALLLILATLALVAASGSSARSSATCSVAPNPVVQHSGYTATLTGAAPNSTYYFWVSQSHNNQITQQHAVGALITDSAGTGSYTTETDNPTHYLQPGEVSVKFTTYPSGARVATCSFTVTS